MTSMQSDSESNVSGFIRYNCDDKNFKHLYKSMIENMQMINQDVVEIERNMKNIVKQAGPLESQLTALMQSFPTHNVSVAMEVE